MWSFVWSIGGMRRCMDDDGDGWISGMDCMETHWHMRCGWLSNPALTSSLAFLSLLFPSSISPFPSTSVVSSLGLATMSPHIFICLSV
jgi:hypothetical protein